MNITLLPNLSLRGFEGLKKTICSFLSGVMFLAVAGLFSLPASAASIMEDYKKLVGIPEDAYIFMHNVPVICKKTDPILAVLIGAAEIAFNDPQKSRVALMRLIDEGKCYFVNRNKPTKVIDVAHYLAKDGIIMGVMVVSTTDSRHPEVYTVFTEMYKE